MSLTDEKTRYHIVPLAGNSFVTKKHIDTTEGIYKTGLRNWICPHTIISTYFRVSRTGLLSLKLTASVPSGVSTIKVTIVENSISVQESKSKIVNIEMTGKEFKCYPVGDFKVTLPGYLKVDFQGISRTGGFFADVSTISFGGSAATGENIFCHDPEYYYWARRGPSCHLFYDIPTSVNISYFYNEIFVPIEKDKIGSFFMANGFDGGYFGMQVNSSSERRILFSVWSPFQTDDPACIPEKYRVRLIRKGEGVHTGEFGNEGSGGQSYLKFNWKTETVYKFLLKGEPDRDGVTNFTAWFFAPEAHNWKLIASWKRPQTSTHLKGIHSFIENFLQENGHLNRRAEYRNQWVRTSEAWHRVSGAKFTVNTTYKAKQRIDAEGGVVNNGFFLQNGGFFETVVKPETKFSFPAFCVFPPEINLESLP